MGYNQFLLYAACMVDLIEKEVFVSSVFSLMSNERCQDILKKYAELRRKIDSLLNRSVLVNGE